ncbi:hypothetical protein EKO27_g289 [Xylaria grammica]|uniref:Uncharacterized protein n=1 Tax=Xylaria grammica TaxID=363999 RepID=A0A439DK92_9PEZI|nr:hypothetical protein EKO27_g289 [Xylaria grammica]
MGRMITFLPKMHLVINNEAGAYELIALALLIGAGTAVAAAATGLVFGQLAEGEQQYAPHNSLTSGSIRRKFVTDHDLSNTNYSRPGTNSTTSTAPPHAQDQAVLPLRQSTVTVNAAAAQARIHRRPTRVQITPTKPPASRQSLAKQGDSALASPIAEDSCDSVSSSGSWIRRLTIRPLSQHGSLRSSIGPDSPSIFSFGSAAPILSSRDSSSQLPPNKLVKRAPGTNIQDTGFPKRRGSRVQMTLRRPATSHQRSATLQHQLNAEDLPPLPKFSFDQPHRPRAKTVGSHQEKRVQGLVENERSRWKSFWHTKLSNTTVKTTPLRGTDGSGQTLGRLVRPDQQRSAQVYLVTPGTLTMNGPQEVVNGFLHHSESPSHTNIKDSPRTSIKEPDPTEVTPSKTPKRSISMQFSSPTNWIARTGSLRRRKRGSETTRSKRHVSPPTADDEDQPESNKSVTPEKIQKDVPISQAEVDLAAIFRPPETRRGPPSPIPPLSRLSSFHLDMNDHDPSSSVVPDRSGDAIISPSVSSRVHSHTSHTRTLERASTVGSSEYHRGFTSGDDDDTDFKTDTPFDSFRTVASGCKKGTDSPLETMFDDSPPRTAGNNSKMKRLSVQEILGPSFDGGNIMEEDESTSTPIRGTYEEFEARFRAASIEDEKLANGHPAPDFPIDRDYTRLSLDDDDDLGWAREEESEFYNHLSPPSSMNSRRGSPKFRNPLGRINGSLKRDVRFDSTQERPRSTVFDWAEPPAHDKREKKGYIHRPKTVHGKQELDLRGGRSASRKGFVATHVRSQSVPVVPDPTETAKSAPKFGTWGLGQKNVSEDWDDDFEFEEDAVSITGPPGKKNENQFSMFVPASIQATQPTVKAHSGHIRELSLLVNDLKRLCRLGREMNMLVGSSAKLWHEAEGIIALASPDEDTEVADVDTVNDMGSTPIDERFLEQGFDGASLEVRESLQHQNSPSSRRRSVFAPDDDIFGTWDNVDTEAVERPKTPENPIMEPHSTSVARSVMQSMRKPRTTFDIDVDDDHDNDDNINEHSNGKMNFDTNSLKELVKRAGDLRDSLSELIRREDHLTQSPIRSPKHTRPDGSPAFTRVFDEPTSSPTRHISHNHNNKPVLSSTPVGTSPSNGISRRMQMMIVR